MPKIRLTSDVLKQKSGEVTQCMEEQQEKEAPSADRCTPMWENMVAEGLRS